MPSYTDSQHIEGYLQRSLTTTETVLAADLIPAASEWIDNYTGRGYGPVTVIGEQHGVEGPFVYLTRRPVVAITNMVARSITVGAPLITLNVGVDYELLDAQHGALSLMNWWDLFMWGQRDMVRDMVGSHMGKLLSIDYSVSAAVPPTVQQAATALVAHWLRDPDAQHYSSVNLGGVSVSFAASFGVPEIVKSLLSTKRRLVFS